MWCGRKCPTVSSRKPAHRRRRMEMAFVQVQQIDPAKYVGKPAMGRKCVSQILRAKNQNSTFLPMSFFIFSTTNWILLGNSKMKNKIAPEITPANHPSAQQLLGVVTITAPWFTGWCLIVEVRHKGHRMLISSTKEVLKMYLLCFPMTSLYILLIEEKEKWTSWLRMVLTNWVNLKRWLSPMLPWVYHQCWLWPRRQVG